MNEKHALPEASRRFEDAILAGGAAIRRRERRRAAWRRRAWLAVPLAACLALAFALPALRAPRPDAVTPSALEGISYGEGAASVAGGIGGAAASDASGTARGADTAGAGWPVGAWLQVTDGGSLDAIAPFYAEPSPKSRSAELPVGALVQVREGTREGFLPVSWAGVNGWIREECLRDPAGTEVPMRVRAGVTAVPLYAEADANSAVAGMLPAGTAVVCAGVSREAAFYPADSDELFTWASVTWPEGGLEGWLSAEELRFVPAPQPVTILFAALSTVDARGRLCVEMLQNEEERAVLQSLLSHMRLSDTSKEPVGPLLELGLSDGTSLRFTVASGGGAWMIAENLSVYDVDEGQDEVFWSLFPESLARLAAMG